MSLLMKFQIKNNTMIALKKSLDTRAGAFEASHSGRAEEKKLFPKVLSRLFISLFTATLLFAAHTTIIGHGHGCGHGGGHSSGGHSHGGSRSGRPFGKRSEIPWTAEDKALFKEIAFSLMFLALGGVTFLLLMRRRMKQWIGRDAEVTKNIVPGHTGQVKVMWVGTWPAQSKCMGEKCSILWPGTEVKVVGVGWYYVIVERADGKHGH